MKDIATVAAYIANRYQAEYGERIDEMKLHKLLYFAQRECLIRKDEPLFPEEMEGWRLGPVAPVIRGAYEKDSLDKNVGDKDMAEYKETMDYVFENYAPKDSWSLSRLSHGEICWKISRKGIAPNDSSDVPIPTEDIRLDALRIRERREMLAQQGLL